MDEKEKLMMELLKEEFAKAIFKKVKTEVKEEVKEEFDFYESLEGKPVIVSDMITKHYPLFYKIVYFVANKLVSILLRYEKKRLKKGDNNGKQRPCSKQIRDG